MAYLKLLTIISVISGAFPLCIQRTNFHQCADYCLKFKYGRIVFECCDLVEKHGVCPSKIVETYDHNLDISSLHCCTDFDCPGRFKCCTEANYRKPFSLCKPPVYSNENAVEITTITTPRERDIEGSGSGSGSGIDSDNDFLFSSEDDHEEIQLSENDDQVESTINFDTTESTITIDKKEYELTNSSEHKEIINKEGSHWNHDTENNKEISQGEELSPETQEDIDDQPDDFGSGDSRLSS